MRSALLLSSILSFGYVNAATKLAVIEFGKGGCVRRTTSTDASTTVDGVASFWSALHRKGRRKLQHAGMTVVPDLFQNADGGVVIGLSGSGVDLDTMPFVSGLVSEETASDVVGLMEVKGTRLDSLMPKLDDWETIDISSLVESAKKHGEKVGLSGLKTVVDSETAATIDQKMQDVLEGLKDMAQTTGKNIVVHLVVEEDVAASRRRHLARRLDDAGDNNQEGDNNNNNNGDGDNDNGDNDGNNNNNGDGQQQVNGYYGYGYYNQYGDWVTPYKTMFQIQYFNVVLWTSIGLVTTLFFTIYLMMNMPLEPDTLLFGESAKIPGDD